MNEPPSTPSWHPSAGLGGPAVQPGEGRFQAGAPAYGPGLLMNWFLPGSGFLWLREPRALLGLLGLETLVTVARWLGAPTTPLWLILISAYLASFVVYHVLYTRRYAKDRPAFSLPTNGQERLSVILGAALLAERALTLVLPRVGP